MIKIFVCIPFLLVLTAIIFLKVLSKRYGSERCSKEVEILSMTFLPLSVMFAVIFYIIMKEQGL